MFSPISQYTINSNYAYVINFFHWLICKLMDINYYYYYYLAGLYHRFQTTMDINLSTERL